MFTTKKKLPRDIYLPSPIINEEEMEYINNAG